MFRHRKIILPRFVIIIGLFAAVSFYLVFPRRTSFLYNSETDFAILPPKNNNSSKIDNDLKYILLWNSLDYSPFYFFGEGRQAFIDKNCTKTNCYVTSDKNYLNGDVTKFDAIAFNGNEIENPKWGLPDRRSPHQKYIFFDMESAANYPICNKRFDNFFNWTATYKLNSDILYPYILVKDANGNRVGPKIDLKWDVMEQFASEEQIAELKFKRKTAAWFVSNCETKGGREHFVRNLERFLEPYGLNIDIYGSCGPYRCPKDVESDCDKKLEDDYYFYMSLENSLIEDYVTEKVLTAVQHNAVPIVYGGANYSRFLPPGSYIDGRNHTFGELAALMSQLVLSKKLYAQYFRWKKNYSFHDPSRKENVCNVCEALNNKTKVETISIYKDFRGWWNPNYVNLCYNWIF